MYIVIQKLLSLQVLKYISVRAILAFILSFFVVLLFGDKFIQKLRSEQKDGQPINDYVLETHANKIGTPTMGGLIITLSTLLSSLLFCDLSDVGFLLCCAVFVFFSCIGIIDDYRKLKFKNNSKGITAKQKFIMQTVFSVVCIVLYTNYYQSDTRIYFPIFKMAIISIPSILYYIWCSFVVVGSSNAVNLTDGLDGLASGSIISSAVCMAIVSYLSGNSIYAHYLNIQHVVCASDICILLSSVVGATMGFMWYNAPPAKIFMGDTGSLSIGALLGFVSVIIKQEFIFAVIGGVFVFETLSVIIQVGCYKLFGKRPFIMTPIHHHFERKGIPEATIVFRFWIVSILLAIVGLSMIKIR